MIGLDLEFNIGLEASDVESQNLVLSFVETESYPDWISLQEEQIFGIPTELGFFYIPLSLDDGDTIIIDTVELQVERFKPEIISISDVPDDQGSNVELSFSPSFFDNGENFNQSYSIFRYDLIEPDSLGWVSLGSVDALGDLMYTYMATTLFDSSNHSDGLTQFKVVASMNNGIFHSDPLFGYSTDDIAPSSPTNLFVEQSGSALLLSWECTIDEDFHNFNIYRSLEPDFEISPENFLGYSAELSFVDSTAELFTNYYYKVNAADYAGNLSSSTDESEGYIYINLVPSLGLIDSQFVNEDDSFQYILSATDGNEDDILTFFASTEANEISITISHDTLNISLEEDWFGTADILASVSDGVLADSVTFVLTVDAVNDAPSTFNLVSPGDSSNIVITDLDISNQISLNVNWDASVDVDNEQLIYGFILYDGPFTGTTSSILFDTLVSNNMVDISYESFISILETNGGNSIASDWTVFVTDEVDTAWASEIRFLTIDASPVLSIEGNYLPIEFALYQNYPNPFNPSTKIKYDLPEDSFVQISIYDITGRKIKNLLNDKQFAGHRQIRWDATNDRGEGVSAGMYIYTIDTGHFRSTKKMVLLK